LVRAVRFELKNGRVESARYADFRHARTVRRQGLEPRSPG